MQNKNLWFVVLLATVGLVLALPDSRARDIVTALQNTYYDAQTGLWNTAGWWNSANALEAVIEYMMFSNNVTLTNVVANTFAHTTPQETMNGSYDDEQWWAIAWIRAYQLTRLQQYKDRAVILWNDILRHAWDNVCGGGVWWSSQKTYKNAITNELFFVLSMELYRSDKNSTYLDWARKEWAWFEASGMINSDNLINDGLDNCKNNHQTTWTYNQGVILGGLVDLAAATNNDTLLTIAQNIADAVISKLTYPNGVLREPCETNSDCGADGPQFKGIYMRYLGFLIGSLPDSPKRRIYVNWVKQNADSIWNSDRNARNLCGLKWVGPSNQTPTAKTQSSALDCFNANRY